MSKIRLRQVTSRWLRAFIPISVLIASASCSSVEYPDGPSQANPLDAIESTMLFSINDLRATKGLLSLKQCAVLNVSASAHADDMRDNNYFDDDGPDGSTPRSRACAAGYQAACGNAGMGELVAKGVAEAEGTLASWEKDATASPILLDPSFKVVGVGRSMGGEAAIWTVDFGSQEDASCD